MKINTKLKITKITSLVMIATTLGILIWFVGFIISITFDLNIFDSNTTEFLFAALGGAFVLVTCSAILNVSLNISIIAEKNLVFDDNEETQVNFKKVLAYGAIGLLVVIGFLFGGDYFSRRKIKNDIISEGNDMVSRYSNTIEEIKTSLNDKKQIASIPTDLKFLSSIKSNFPSVVIITSDQYHSELVFLTITSWTDPEDLAQPYFEDAFYECTKNDCDYLYDVFLNDVEEPYFWYEDDDYLYYYPVENGDNDFVLLFSKWNRYGFVGSERISD